MARYRPVDRGTPALLPVDIRDWVPASHVVWLIIDVVDRLDLSMLETRKRRSGRGRPGYDPRMLMTLLVYAYACGVRSARQIQARCRVDATFRVACANDIPDHTTIADFRRRFGMIDGAVHEVFTQVLRVCAEAGLGRLTFVSGDGTKMSGNAALDANRTEQRCRALAEQALTEASAADKTSATTTGKKAGKAGGGQAPAVLPGMDLLGEAELDDFWRRAPSRQQRIDRCVAEFDAERAAQQAQRQQAAQEYLQAARAGTAHGGHIPQDARVEAAEVALAKEVAAWTERQDRYRQRCIEADQQGGLLPAGRKPVPLDQDKRVLRARARLDREIAAATTPATADTGTDANAKAKPPKRNLTDPDSRIMHTATGGYLQGYNGQEINTDDRLILHVHVTNAGNDYDHAIPLMTGAETGAAIVTHAHTHPDHNPIACHTHLCRDPNRNNPDHDPIACHTHITQLGTTLFDAGYHSQTNITAPGPDRLIAPCKTRDLPHLNPPPPDTNPNTPTDPDPVTEMARRIATPEGRAAYKHRAPASEGTNANIKTILPRFSMRGLSLANAEFTLAATVSNIQRLHHHQRRLTTT